MTLQKTLLASLILPMGILLSACNNSNTQEAAQETQAPAQSEQTAQSTGNPIKDRQDTMKNWKDAMGIMGDMVKNPDTFNADEFKTQAQFVADSANDPWQHYANADNVGEAQPAVWEKPEEFAAAIEKFKQATADLNTTAQGATSVDQVKDAFGALGGSCKGCHEVFKGE